MTNRIKPIIYVGQKTTEYTKSVSITVQLLVNTIIRGKIKGHRPMTNRIFQTRDLFIGKPPFQMSFIVIILYIVQSKAVTVRISIFVTSSFLS